MRMWMISQRGEVTDDTSRELQRWVKECGGLILIMTRSGPLVALDDEDAPIVEQHSLVEHMGPVELNPHGLAAKRLEQVFAQNLSRQIDLAGLTQGDGASAP
jgi:hypothetical protein